jgi:hypothetical protein
MPSFAEMLRKGVSPGFVAGVSGFKPLSSKVSSPEITVSGSSPFADPAPSKVSTTLDKFSTASVDIAATKVKEVLLPWVIKETKVGESIEPRAFLPKETRIFELLMRSITKAQYDEFLSKEYGFDDDQRSAISNLAKLMNLVPAANPSSKTDENSTDGSSVLTPSNPTDIK